MFDSIKPADIRDVDLTGGFWGERQRINRQKSVYTVRDTFREHGRFSAFRCDWKEGEPDKPHFFYDSDVAKWIETAAYILMKEDDPELRANVEEVIDLIEKNQQPDGYFNIWFTVVEPGQRFTKRDCHELYCAGHLTEAAVAYCEATGDGRFLKLMEKYIDLIDRTFRVERSAAFVTPGHEELELALVRLYRFTKNEKYLTLAKFFIDERGRNHEEQIDWSRDSYNQSHQPVREQRTAEGHAVRASYLYCGMADVARETGDASLMTACEALFDNITRRRMYVTGGVGQSSEGEAFTVDYDLPDDSAYSETCAAIALAMFAGRMQDMTGDSKYADIVEREMYNGILAGVSLDGGSFFYEDPLEILMRERDTDKSVSHSRHWPDARRHSYQGCSCCPPNLTRFIASLGRYFYSTSADTVYIHQYGPSTASLHCGGREVTVTQRTGYPLDGDIDVTVQGAEGLTIALRVPGYCRSFCSSPAGRSVRGYLYIDVTSGDFTVGLHLDMEPRFVRASSEVWCDEGRAALMRGPLVYCLEEADNGPLLRALTADTSSAFEQCEVRGLPGVPALSCRGTRDLPPEDGSLYFDAGELVRRPAELRFIPYYAFADREVCDMTVFVRVD